MRGIGIDVGSTYTKYVVLDDGVVAERWAERTPVRQREHFESVVAEMSEHFPEARIVSCGYGRDNVEGMRCANEIAMLAKGLWQELGESCLALDIGGQDSKAISQEGGVLRDFFVSDRCAAGSGMFLAGIGDLLQEDYMGYDLREVAEPEVRLSSTCAVFAQSEVVRLVADGVDSREIMLAGIWQVFAKARQLVGKLPDGPVVITGGLSSVVGIERFAAMALGRECRVVGAPGAGAFLAAEGCAVAACG